MSNYIHNGDEWKKHDAYKPNTKWDGNTFYRVMGGKWVKQGAFVPYEEALPYPDNCLTFSSIEPFTIGVANQTKNWDGTLYYSTDAITWSEWDGTTAIESAEHGADQRIYMRGSGNIVITGETGNGWALNGSNIVCCGNIETLLDYEIVANGEHPTMGQYCYCSMFLGCTSLVTAPELRATILEDGCYSYMFYECTSLINAPALPATTLKSNCYGSMFYGCTSLISIPALSATTLYSWCYAFMFEGCTSIKLSEKQSNEYPYEYRIPTNGTGSNEFNSILHMFTNTGGTFTGTPEINTTYYTSNTVVPSAKEPDAYRYNGVELPDINTVWTDKETYPYAMIKRAKSGGECTLFVYGDDPYYTEQAQGGEGGVVITPVPIQTFDLGNDGWVLRSEDADYGVSHRVEVFEFVWTNVDIKNKDNNSVYFPESEPPVPVYA